MTASISSSNAPRAFRCHEAEWLEPHEKSAILSRVACADRILEELQPRFLSLAIPDFAELVGEAELDLLQVQDYFSFGGGNMSRWVLHDSIDFERIQNVMRSSGDIEILKAINRGEVSLEESFDDVRLWFLRAIEDARMSIRLFQDADGIELAIVALWVLDVVLGRMLVACFKLRLSRLYVFR